MINKAQRILREYMRDCGLKTQKQLAAKIGITETYISLILRGKRTFGARKALEVSQILGVPMEDLFR